MTVSWHPDELQVRTWIGAIPHDTPIVVLTGAGISQESGLGTFRGAGGTWENVDIEKVATRKAIVTNPGAVHRFYNARRKRLLTSNVLPNSAHLALARLENEWNARVTIVTQNVDNLHERAGSQNVIHIHGELLKIRCEACKGVSTTMKGTSVRSRCTSCRVVGEVRPNIVLFGEHLFRESEVHKELGQAGLFVAVGTSGAVYPAAGFVRIVREFGPGKALTIEVNKEHTDISPRFKGGMYGLATEVVPNLVETLFRNADSLKRA